MYFLDREFYYIAKGDHKFVCRTDEQKQEAFIKSHLKQNNNLHWGINITMQNLVKDYYWSRMTKDVTDMVSCLNSFCMEMYYSLHAKSTFLHEIKLW